MDKLIRELEDTPGVGVASPAVTSVGAKGPLKVDAMFIEGAPSGWFKPGAGKTEWFKDHEHGPDMVVVPAGEFLMGSTDDAEEQPVHNVVIPSPFAVGKFAVTFAEWDACVADGGCNGYKPGEEGWGRDRRPVINVSWHDAKLYIDWLNARTGKTYRLLSEAEWEYVTRAGTDTPFWWGREITAGQANFYPNRKTVPVDTFEPNPWGLFNVHGNVWEWCEDIWQNTYSYAPTDGSAWLRGSNDRRVVRGGSWSDYPQNLRAAFRYRFPSVIRYDFIGFRLARTLNP
jgi:formylglycine-generating enzyme required for sulfatase activity